MLKIMLKTHKIVENSVRSTGKFPKKKIGSEKGDNKMEIATIRLKAKRHLTIDEMIKAGDYIIRSLNDYYDAIGNKRIVDYALNPDANGISYRYKFSDGTIKDQYWKLGELFNILYNSNWACYRY